MCDAVSRIELRFTSGGDVVAAWLYRPPAAVGQVPCVVMAHGFSLTRHDGLPAYAERLAEAGVAVLVFDHRHLGDSHGERRQRFRKREQLEDWRRAIVRARSLSGVDPGRIVLWGYSMSGGHVATLAALDPGIAAALVLCPFVDGLGRVRATPLSLTAWILPRALADVAGRHVTIPVTGQPGSRAAMTLPGEADGFARVVVPDSPWRNEISPGVFATVAFHRPVAWAKRIACPLWVGLGERDITVPRRAVERLASRAPKGELQRYPYDHFDAFVGDEPERVAADQVDFLRRHRLAPAA
jgi:dienelactone hydrolase